MTILSKKTFAAAVGAVTLAASGLATAAPAEAGWRGRGGWHGGWRGPAIVGGLALGALAAGAYAAPYYAGECYITRQPVTNRWGDVIGYRRVRVCD